MPSNSRVCTFNTALFNLFSFPRQGFSFHPRITFHMSDSGLGRHFSSTILPFQKQSHIYHVNDKEDTQNFFLFYPALETTDIAVYSFCVTFSVQ